MLLHMLRIQPYDGVHGIDPSGKTRCSILVPQSTLQLYILVLRTEIVEKIIETTSKCMKIETEGVRNKKKLKQQYFQKN
jgi:hypothetical protein